MAGTTREADGARLYLKAWDYNTARIVTELAEVVKEHGGRVKPTRPAIISDRSATEEAEPITVTHTSYITFVLDDAYYYYQMSSNPFFEFHYLKAPIKDGQRSRDASLEEDSKEWLYNCFLKSNCGQQDIIEAANLIFNLLSNAPTSEIIPERMEKIDF